MHARAAVPTAFFWLVSALFTVPRALALVPPAGLANSPGSLLSHASRVSIGRSDYRYWWLSDREVLVMRDHPAKSSRQHVWRAFVRRDVRTGVERQLGALTRLYNRQPVVTWPIDVSPDRRWLLWQNETGRAFVARLDGTGYQHWKVRNSSDPVCWTPDSRSVVTMDLDGTWRYTATERTVADPEDVAAFPLDLDPRVGLAQADHVCVSGILGGNSLIVVKRTPGAKAEDRLVIWKATTWENPPIAERHEIALPDGATIDDWGFSPDAARIAWLVTYPERDRKMQGLWVWDANTAALNRVGSIELRPGKDDGALSSLAWLPGSKRISLAGRGQELLLGPIGAKP